MRLWSDYRREFPRGRVLNMSEIKSQLFYFVAAVFALLIIYALVDSGGPGSIAQKVWL